VASEDRDPKRRLVIRTDGAARGNPGPAGAGFVIETVDGSVVEEGSRYLGTKTNNQAEYEALIFALEATQPDRNTELLIYSDSELLVKQLNGEYKVKTPHIRECHIAVSRLLLDAGEVTIRHVLRDENEEADALANQAIDAYAMDESTDEETGKTAGKA
jgi:ribonuclease HI